MKDDNNKHVTKVVSSGNKITAPTVPTKDGCEFLGWYEKDSNGKLKNTVFDLNTAITADITLYARFTPNIYTVSYNAGANGTGTVAAGSKTHGVDFTLSSNTFTRTGYTQTGWATSDGGEKVYDLGGSYTANTAVTLYPVWTVNQYTITVKPENGETDITITKDYGITVTAPTLTRDGYAFDGWDKAFPTTMPAGSMTITAKWKDITAPTGEIKLGANSWRSFLNHITFGLFFKDTQEITITATDNSGEDVTIEYLLSDKELSVTELANKTFTEYTGNFNIEPNNEYVIYAKLTDKSGNQTYINSNGIVLDNVKPVISGITNGKTYCAAQTVTVSDKYEVTVTVNGNPVTPDTNGQFTLSAAKVEQKIVVTDKAGNKAEMTVTVNDGHTCEWQSESGRYWKKCKFCGDETAKKDIPEITINGADKVCKTQDYKFTVTVPEGATDVIYGYEFENRGDSDIALNPNNGIYSATISSEEFVGESSFKLLVSATTADGYTVSTSKTVQILSEHTGGTADCTHKAVCTVCGEKYGEVDSTKHTDEKEWSTRNETQHEQTWKCCGAVEVALENHEWKNGVCEECGYICLHTGGTADCTHKAKCEVCGDEYGKVDSTKHDLENIRGNAATVTEKGNTEYWHCNDCDKYFSDKDGKNEIDLKDTVIGKLPPEIIDGKGQSLTAGEKKELTFRSNAAFGDFIRVELDGETVDEKNYTVKEGSTIVTLKADYVATLSAGEHTLGIVSESGTATTTFTVNAKVVDNKSPQTGYNSRMVLWLALLFVSGGAMAGAAAYSKKKKRFVK